MKALFIAVSLSFLSLAMTSCESAPVAEERDTTGHPVKSDTAPAADTSRASGNPGVPPVNKEEDFIKVFKAVAAAFRNEDMNALNSYIHPSRKAYIVYRPGAIDMIDTFHNFQSLYKKIYGARPTLSRLSCSLLDLEIPASPCENDVKGCYWKKENNYNRLSTMTAAFDKYGFKENITPGAKAGISLMERSITIHTALLDHGMAIDFSLGEDGKWFISVIDLGRYSCSA
ncbi:MAG: hypothetical protein M3Q97_07240 [Bacteroidota bacterium]|nr:hypothetical protein [Bacteroidota bacterium]